MEVPAVACHDRARLVTGMERAFHLGDCGRQLWTRTVARKARERLVAVLDQAAVGDTVIIDLARVEVFDYSFANEFFGKTLLALPKDFPGRFLVVEHLDTYTRENLQKALESIDLSMIERTRMGLSLIGKVHPVDQQTFDAVIQAGRRVTAASLKVRLGINPTAANERLAKLAGLGILRRERSVSAAGREQYEYVAPG